MIKPKEVIKYGLLKISLLLVLNSHGQSGFYKEQIKYNRVKSAVAETWKNTAGILLKNGTDTSNFEVLIRVFKNEKILEVWTRSKLQPRFTHFKNYSICMSSGDLGPKRKEGDGQVPEGFYVLDLFNPTSNYYLSMRISYPNASDKILGKKPYGGAIMIHGNCVTIGCIPITDEKIKELYVLCLKSKATGHAPLVHSFPFKMTQENMLNFGRQVPDPISSFWQNIKTGYDWFEQEKIPKKVSVNEKGQYQFN